MFLERTFLHRDSADLQDLGQGARSPKWQSRLRSRTSSILGFRPRTTLSRPIAALCRLWPPLVTAYAWNQCVLT